MWTHHKITDKWEQAPCEVIATKPESPLITIRNTAGGDVRELHRNMLDNFTVLGDTFGNHQNESFLHIRSIYVDYRKNPARKWILAIAGKTFNATNAQCHYATKERKTITQKRADIYMR